MAEFHEQTFYIIEDQSKMPLCIVQSFLSNALSNNEPCSMYHNIEQISILQLTQLMDTTSPTHIIQYQQNVKLS